ncbi:MAG: hypothetical protein RIC35_02625 [Marinoscillum sp.]
MKISYIITLFLLSISFLTRSQTVLITPIKVEASSVASGTSKKEGVEYEWKISPNSLMDGDFDFGWMPEVNKEGATGEWFKFIFSGRIRVEKVLWHNLKVNAHNVPSYNVSAYDVPSYNLVKKVEITTSNGDVFTKYLSKIAGPQVLKLNCECEWIRFEILEVYPGGGRGYTAVQEVEFVGTNSYAKNRQVVDVSPIIDNDEYSGVFESKGVINLGNSIKGNEYSIKGVSRFYIYKEDWNSSGGTTYGYLEKYPNKLFLGNPRVEMVSLKKDQVEKGGKPGFLKLNYDTFAGEYQRLGNASIAADKNFRHLSKNLLEHTAHDKLILGRVKSGFRDRANSIVIYSSFNPDSLSNIVFQREIDAELIYKGSSSAYFQEMYWSRRLGYKMDSRPYQSPLSSISYMLDLVTKYQGKGTYDYIYKTFDEVIKSMPFLETINVYFDGVNQFRVSIRRSGSRIYCKYQTTPASMEYERNVVKAFQERERELEQTLRSNKLDHSKEMSDSGHNPSGEYFEVDYSTPAGLTLEKIYYGHFDEVNSAIFNDLFIMFLSQISGQRHFVDNADLASVDFTLYSLEYENLVSREEEVQVQINMEKRFERRFKSTVRYDHFANWRVLALADLNKILTKYPPDSIVFKQLVENLYRYSEGLEPLKSF